MSINATLFVQAIVFAILVWFTMKFVWPPIAVALDERAKKIADGLAAADRAKAELSSANKRVEEELALSRNETAARLADAERRALVIIEEAKARANEEGVKIVAAAKAEAEQQTVKARETLREQVLDFVAALRAGNPLRARSEALYRWLIKPVEPVLAEARVDTLVAVPDGVLRLLPLGALNDGRQWLLEKLAVATVPGLTLTASAPRERAPTSRRHHSSGRRSRCSGLAKVPRRRSGWPARS